MYIIPIIQNLATKVEYSQLTHLKKNENSTQILENERKDFVTYTYSPNIGWSFFTAVPYKDLTGGIIQIGRHNHLDYPYLIDHCLYNWLLSLQQVSFGLSDA